MDAILEHVGTSPFDGKDLSDGFYHHSKREYWFINGVHAGRYDYEANRLSDVPARQDFCDAQYYCSDFKGNMYCPMYNEYCITKYTADMTVAWETKVNSPRGLCCPPPANVIYVWNDSKHKIMSLNAADGESWMDGGTTIYRITLVFMILHGFRAEATFI